MQRWIARLLLLVMIVPALGPLALAYAAPVQAPHCVRQSAKPVMECHRGMSMAMAMSMPMAPEPSSETEFHATEQCCQNHDCCRGMAAPRWAQPQSQLLSRQAPTSAETLPALHSQLLLSVFSDNDSARAPPRS